MPTLYHKYSKYVNFTSKVKQNIETQEANKNHSTNRTIDDYTSGFDRGIKHMEKLNATNKVNKTLMLDSTLNSKHTKVFENVTTRSVEDKSY